MSCRSVRNWFSTSLRKTTVWHCKGPILFAQQSSRWKCGRWPSLSTLRSQSCKTRKRRDAIFPLPRTTSGANSTLHQNSNNWGQTLSPSTNSSWNSPPRFQISPLTCLWTKELLCREALQLLLREMPVWKAIGRRLVAHGWQWQRRVSDGGWKVGGKRHPRGRKPKGLARKVCAR